MTAKLTIRVPPDLHDRLVEHKDATGTPISQFGIRAMEAALDKAGVPPVAKRPGRRKQKQPA